MFIRKAVLTGALALGLAVAGSSVAFAGDTPSPSYSPSPSPTPTPRAALWQFDFTGANIDGLTLNDVRGVGAIPMSRWQETDLSPTVSKFFRGPNSVTLRHNRLPLPVINLRTCTATFDQVGHFRIIAGTGTGAGLRVVPNTDTYLLRGVVSVDLIQHRGAYNRRNTVCPLQFLSPGQVRAELESNGSSGGFTPTLVDFDVQGNAQLVRVAPTGPGHFSQTNSPTATPVSS